MKRKRALPIIEKTRLRREPLRLNEQPDQVRDERKRNPSVKTLDLDKLELELEGIELVSDHGGYDPYDKKLTIKKPASPRRQR